MASETPEPVEDDEHGNQDLFEPVFKDVAVLGTRMNFVNVLAAVLFAGVLLAVLFTGEGGIVLYVLIPIILMNLWSCLTLFIRRPRAVIDDGVFSLRLLPTWRTPATNVANLELRDGKMAITFDLVQSVQPQKQRDALSRNFQKQGCHILTGRGVFLLEQLNELRDALGMPVQEQDRFADFQSTLNRLTPRVILTPTFIAANVIVFLVMALTGAGIFQPDIALMIGWGANFGPLTSNGQWWRLLTSMFLHFGVIHLLVNMWILRDIGRIVERLVGNSGFAIGYLISGFFGSVASVFWHESAVSAGASGAVFGVFGMLLGFVTFHQQSIPMEVIKDHRGNAITFLIFNVVIGFSIPWIDQSAHIGGFLAGCLCGLVLGCDLTEAPVKRKVRNQILAVSGVMIAALAVVVLPIRHPDLIMIGTRINEVDAEKVAIYQQAMSAVESGEQTPTEAARLVSTSIVPTYVELAASLKQVRPRDERQQRMKSVFAEYIQLRREGWELIADAIENNDIVRKGLAVEKFEAARSIFAELNPEKNEQQNRFPTDLPTEVAVLAVCEDRALKRYDELMQHFSLGNLNDQELAKSVEDDVLPVWLKGQQRFLDAAKRLPPQNQPVVLRIANYLVLRRDGWLLQVESLREQSEAKRTQSIEKLEAAARASQSIWPE